MLRIKKSIILLFLKISIKVNSSSTETFNNHNQHSTYIDFYPRCKKSWTLHCDSVIGHVMGRKELNSAKRIKTRVFSISALSSRIWAREDILCSLSLHSWELFWSGNVCYPSPPVTINNVIFSLWMLMAG